MVVSKHRIRSFIGFIFFLSLALGQYFWQTNTNFFYTLFLSFRFITIAAIYLIREPSQEGSSRLKEIISWIGAIVPFLYSSNFERLWVITTDLSAVMLLGSLFSFWGIVALGRSFGITPSKRTLVSDGPYKFTRHPIYLGYFLTEIAVVISIPSILNLCLFLLSSVLYVFRSKWENEIHKNPPGARF